MTHRTFKGARLVAETESPTSFSAMMSRHGRILETRNRKFTLEELQLGVLRWLGLPFFPVHSHPISDLKSSSRTGTGAGLSGGFTVRWYARGPATGKENGGSGLQIRAFCLDLSGSSCDVLVVAGSDMRVKSIGARLRSLLFQLEMRFGALFDQVSSQQRSWIDRCPRPKS